MTVCDLAGVKDGKIKSLGNSKPEEAQAGRVIDLTGLTLLPGQKDCHIHVMPAYLNLSAVLFGNARTVSEVWELRVQAATLRMLNICLQSVIIIFYGKGYLC
jgi:predicted amidohydrolase YtcJ